ncbi:MAG: hypothetical protein JO311_07415 [Candidatus Eremiobacteraeota bacterium]|nr:hypothetical protein [Candidatus Eremiobacteraeota bacterium]MBV9263440.1 hypothetical protein [Candidatus Eremiobacteraeota bacterium]
MKAPAVRHFALSATLAAAVLCCCDKQRAMPTMANATSRVPSPQLSLGANGRIFVARTAPGRTSGRLNRKRALPLLYVVQTDPGYSEVTVYSAHARDPSPIETITKGLFAPIADCITGDGTLYVTNSPGNSLGWISVYAPGEHNPSRMITAGVNIPNYCAIDAQGNLWVTNDGSRTVTEYKAGSSRPHIAITNGVTNPAGVAIDHSGNIYVANYPTSSRSGSDIVVYAPGTKFPARTITDGVHSAAGITIDSNGTLYVSNYLQSTVPKYLEGKRHPYQTISQGIDAPIAVTVNKKGWLYVTDSAGSPGPAIIEFRPGSLIPSARKITKGLENPDGSAYFPPLLP